jgi:putative ATP-dependent endonuclease of the OLD family
MKVNSIIGRAYGTNDDLLKYMRVNKTECALKFFGAQTEWKVPEYIARAIAE